MLLLLFAGATASASVGSLSVTEANDTSSATATLLIKGAASPTEAGDTLSSAAALLIKGTFAASEASDTPASAGVLPITGTLSLTEAGDTLSAQGAGQPLTTGSLDLAEADDGLSAAAALSITGTISVAEAGDTLAATAAVADAPAPLVFAHVGGDDPRLIRERRQREWREELRRIIDRSFLVASGIIDPVTTQPIPSPDYSAVIDGLLAQALLVDRERREAFIAERERLQEEEAFAILLLAA
ncbi:hypothetical protein [Taklimakanibacter deserti]|uniref:hypothetical protein n=1 Tax=Taklimakanibacter deserti TaxID=2267839 RepID=UPI0013C43995